TINRLELKMKDITKDKKELEAIAKNGNRTFMENIKKVEEKLNAAEETVREIENFNMQYFSLAKGKIDVLRKDGAESARNIWRAIERNKINDAVNKLKEAEAFF